MHWKENFQEKKEGTKMEDIAQANIEVVLPNVAMAKQAMAQFEQIKTEILNNDTDIVMIEGKKYIKRSGWRKIALAFNVTTEIVKIEREKIDDVYICLLYTSPSPRD